MVAADYNNSVLDKHSGYYNSMDNLIIWQKWMDPFGADDEPQEDIPEPEFYDENNSIVSGEEDLPNEDKKFIKDHKVSSVRVMATPMGIIPITENTASSKIFNFWVGHTSFSITHKIAEIIENTDGVETLDIFTRYRFRIAIGKVFSDSKVMKNINDNVYEHLG
jgi:hypothetical protein